MNWAQLVAELRGAEYHMGVVTPETQPFRLTFDGCLASNELVYAEERFGFRFPPDLRALLQTALPQGQGFPDWRTNDEAALAAWIDQPKQGILFDVEHGFWLDQWGMRPQSLMEAAEIAGRFIDAAPRLIPVHGHRMIPAEPHASGNPVFSVHQTDIIYYGFDLEDYLRHEFHLGGRKPWPDQVRSIRFWDGFLNVES